ncbi:MAG: 4'-phosphopantetheinyl transferase family protein [Flavobacteriales bacterium]
MYKNISYKEHWLIQDVEVYVFAIQDVLVLDEEKTAIEEMYVDVLAHYKSSKKKDEFVVSRLLHHYVFGHKTPISYRDSAPFFHPNYHLSISHSHGLVAIAYSKTKRFGIDIELKSNKIEKVKHKIFHPHEAYVDKHLTFSRNTFLYRTWTAKEACYKASRSNHCAYKSYFSLNVLWSDASLRIVDTNEEFDLEFRDLDTHCFCLAIAREEENQ